MLAALIALTTPQLGMDAREFYDDMQKRILAADPAAIRHHYTTGPDSWDTDVDITIERTNRFYMGMKNHSVMCDGKWYLEHDFGVITHRRARPSDRFPVIGCETFWGGQPLQPYGTIQEKGMYGSVRLWSLKYIRQGKPQELLIDPKTQLPLGVTLVRKGSNLVPFTVPGYRKQSEVAKTASKSIKAWKSVLMTLRYRENDKNIYEMVLLARNGKAFSYKERGTAVVAVDGSSKKLKWVASTKTVPVKTLGLCGFEAFTGQPAPKLKGESRIVGAPYPLQGWLTESTVGGETRRVIYEEYGQLPAGFAIYKSGKPVRIVEYQVLRVNPDITPMPK